MAYKTDANGNVVKLKKPSKALGFKMRELMEEEHWSKDWRESFRRMRKTK